MSNLLAHVPDLERRREAERLFNAMRAADAAVAEIEDKVHPDIDAKFDPLFEAAEKSYEDAQEAAHQAYVTTRDELRRQRDTELYGPEVMALKTAAEAATKVYEAYDSPAFETQWDDDEGDEVIVRCALTGLPLFEDDILLVDENSGEKVLKAAVGALDPSTDEFVKPELPAAA